MEILEVSLYRGIVGGKISLYALVTYELMSRMKTCEDMWRMNTFDY